MTDCYEDYHLFYLSLLLVKDQVVHEILWLRFFTLNSTHYLMSTLIQNIFLDALWSCKGNQDMVSPFKEFIM